MIQEYALNDKDNVVDGQIWSMNISKQDAYDTTWDLFKQNSIISIDYWITNKKIDYSSFNSDDEIQDFLKESIAKNSQEPNFIHRFINEVKHGDIIIAHKGPTILSGIGVIESEYIFKEDNLNHFRKIKWIYTPNDLKINEKSYFKTYNIVKLNEKYCDFVNNMIVRIAGKDKIIKDKLLNFIFNEYYNKFYSTPQGKDHFNRYELGKENVQKEWQLINQKISNNEDWDDDFWKNLFHKDLELFGMGGNSLKGMILGTAKDKFSKEDIHNLALSFINTVNNLLKTKNNIDEQKNILNDFAGDSYKSYGFSIGRLTPVLFYLDGSSFYPINSKIEKTVNLFSLILDDEIDLSGGLPRYIDNNLSYHNFLKKLNKERSIDNLNIGDIRVFDEFCHWFNDGKLGNYASNKKVGEIFPIKRLFGYGESDILVEENKFEFNVKRNIIYFGAPGTGKSYNLNQDKDILIANYEYNYERVTFHPDYSYANFVGTYKPVPDGESITYSYVPGPFMRILKKAVENPDEPFLLIIEEINRANVAAVFGDVFQLLDRENNESMYPIDATEDMRLYLNQDKICIPQNMFIWATMNSADQGVFPMDTAFKRRWDFKYFSINTGEEEIQDTSVFLNNQEIYWNDLRKAINDELLSYKINEDKLLGPFFAFNEYQNREIPEDIFKEVFKNKIIMYLFEDAARSKRNDLFQGAKGNNNYVTYSQICELFDEGGIEIFCDNIKSKFFQEEE